LVSRCTVFDCFKLYASLGVDGHTVSNCTLGVTLDAAPMLCSPASYSQEIQMEGTLVSLLILVVILGVLWYIFTLIPLPEPFEKIAMIIIALIALIWVLGLLFGYSTPFFRIR